MLKTRVLAFFVPLVQKFGVYAICCLTLNKLSNEPKFKIVVDFLESYKNLIMENNPQELNSFVFKSISGNIVLQFSFRIFSFILNALLFRSVDTALIGACNLNLALLYSTVLFLSREPFRRSLPNLTTRANNKQALVNSIWLCVPSGFVMSAFFGLLWSFVFAR